MIYSDYIKLTENFGLERRYACCYYMGHGVCVFWFYNSNKHSTDMLNRTGFVKMMNDTEIVNESTDEEQIRDFIIKRIEDIKVIIVDKKLKTIEQDF